MTSEDATVASGAVTTRDDTSRSGGSPSDTGRFARWLAGWRVAIRIARRDARRYKWRSALIVAMVGLPVLLLTSGITLMATNDISMAESVPRLMGSAQARIHAGEPIRQAQSPDAQLQVSSNGSDANVALAVPGFASDSAWTSSKVQRLTGGRVIQVLDAYVRFTVGDRRPSMPVLGIDARDPIARGMTELVSGRWGSKPSEIVVTEAGILRGLPRKGKLTTVGPDGKPRQFGVVGVATATTEGELPSLVALPDLVKAVTDPERVSTAFLVERADAVTWSDVRLMNDYGLLVKSRQVFLNPPSSAELDPEVAKSGYSADQRQLDVVLILAAVGLFIETMLLAGPAFAVSAARQRRSLALAASNGAESRQLRRYVLGQAVVLGVGSAAIAVVAGVLLTLAGLTWWQAGHADFVVGPFEVSWPRVGGVFICAVVASLVAALLPAKGIARLDIVSVLTGRSSDRKVRKGLPAAGVLVMVLRGIALIWSVASGGEMGLGFTEYLLVGGTVGLVLGCLMVIPALLALVGRLGTHLVLPLRLATRDTARQRGRSTPAVAAIMAAVAALTALSIGAASDTRQQEDAYRPQRPMGTGSIGLSGEDSSEGGARAVLDRFAPQLRVGRSGFVAGSSSVVESGSLSWVIPVPPGCTEAQIAAGEQPNGGIAGCAPFAKGTVMVQVGDLASISARVPLSISERAVLEGGGILIANPQLVHDGQVSIVAGREAQERPGVVTRHWITQRTRVDAVLVDPRILEAAFGGPASSEVWILEDTATRLGWPVRISSLTLTEPTGTISPEVERAVADRLGDGYVMDVERGFQNPYRVMLLILFLVAVLLVLVASLISTALSLAEGQNDMATLAAVGAIRHTRRGIAASQALVIAACGCLLGVAVGLFPGIAITWPLTTRIVDEVTGRMTVQPPIIVIPWLPLVAVCVVVPLLAAGLAWLAVRRHPQMTRRLA